MPAPDYTKLEPHLLADVFPPMPKEEFEAFKADIKANGIRVPITLYEGKILDGKHRYLAAKEAGHHYGDSFAGSFTDLPAGVDPIKFVLSTNVARRHLTTSQRAIIAARLVTTTNGGNRQSAKMLTDITQEDAAKRLNVSTRLVTSAVSILPNKKLVEDVVKEGTHCP